MYPASTLRICEGHKLECPRCSRLLHRTEISAGFMFAVCEGRTGHARQRCGAHLFIAVSPFIPSDETYAVVSLVSAEEKAAIRELAQRLRQQRHAGVQEAQRAGAGAGGGRGVEISVTSAA